MNAAKTLDELSDEVEAEDAAKAPKPLGLLRQLTRGEWGTKPKPVDALLTLTRKDGKTVPWLPRGTVALLASPGGTGKSTLVMQLVLSVASGVQWLGQFDVPQAGRVCMWSGEDDEEDMHRRAHAVAYEVRAGNQRGIAALPEGWEDNVFRAAVNGEDGRFVDRASDALVETEFFASVLAQVEALQPALVVLDPASRFMGTDENDNAQATRWVTIAEKLKNTTSKPTVLVLVHTGKGKDLDNQEAIRGASALVDGGRWAATLSRRTRDGDEFDILQLRRVKNNRCPPDDGAVLLERDEFGTVKYASAAAESWFAQQLTDLLATGGAKKREAEDAKERAAERANAANGENDMARKTWEGAWWSSGAEILAGSPFVSHANWSSYCVEHRAKEDDVINRLVIVNLGGIDAFPKHTWPVRPVETGWIATGGWGAKLLANKGEGLADTDGGGAAAPMTAKRPPKKSAGKKK